MIEAPLPDDSGGRVERDERTSGIRDDTARAVRECFAEEASGLDPDGADDDKSFAVIGVDSLGGFAVMGDIERHFGISIPDDRRDQIQTVGQAITAVHTLLEEKVAHAGTKPPHVPEVS